jgi:hypothetical protein
MDEEKEKGWAPVRRSWRWRRWFRWYLKRIVPSNATISARDGRLLAIEAERFASQASRNHV